MAYRLPLSATASLLAALCAPTVAQAAVADPVPARLIVRFAAPEWAPGAAVSAAAAQAAAARQVGELASASGRALTMRRRLATGALLLDVGDGSPISATVLEQLADGLRRRAMPGLLSVEPDRLMQASLTPNDPQLGNLWGVAGPAQSDGVAGVNAMSAWDTTSGADAVVAIIDTGYRPHADLSGQVVAQYDFISDTTNSNDGGGRDGDAQDPGDYRSQGQCGASASNSSWHGTHVAGTVAAVGNNALGVVGVAYGAKLVIARVLGACGGYTSDIADAIVWASGGTVSGVPNNPQPAQVINMSLGGQYPCSSSPTLQNAITSARSRNTTVVVAAGNSAMDAGNYSPASCSGVISVASVGEAGGRAYYSNYGTGVDIAAPGGSSGAGRLILSTYNSGSTTPGSDSYAYLQGTSMASPHVAGVAGLLYALNPALTPDQVETAITSTARPFPASCSGCGAGLADAALALASITPGPGRLALSASGYAGTEGSGSSITVTVRRSGGNAGAVSVAYATANGTATAGSDYTATSGTLNWADGDSADKTFTVALLNDATAESSETLTLTLSSPGGGATLASPGNATLTIADDDTATGTLALSSAAYTVSEAGGSAVVTVTRSGGSYGAASVNYVTANGTATAGNDYTARSGTLTWASGDTANKTVSIPIANDTLAESTETFQLRLSAATGAAAGATSTATVSIADNDTIVSAGALSFSASTASVSEGGGSAVVTVRRSGGSSGAVGVSYSTANGSATAGSDYTATTGTLSWADGNTANQTFNVPITDDASTESAETITLTLSAPSGGATLGTPSTQTLTISDNDGTPGTIAVAATSITVAENGGSAVVSVARSGGSYGAASVNYATANGSAAAGSDYTARSGTLTWASGDAASKTVSIPIANDTLAESTETLQLRLSAASGAALGAATTTTVSITDDDTVSSAGALSFTTTALSAAESVGNAVVTVRRSGGSLGAVSVAYATANGTATAGSDYTAASGTLNWADGDATNKTFTVPVSNDATAEANETIALSLSSPGGGATLGTSKTATLTITDDDGAPGSIVLSSASYSITEGNGAVTITLQRTGGSTGSASINYVTANGTATAGNDYTAKSGTVTWANGDAANKSFTISVSNDTLKESAETFQVRLSGPVTASLGATSTATVTINDND